MSCPDSGGASLRTNPYSRLPRATDSEKQGAGCLACPNFEIGTLPGGIQACQPAHDNRTSPQPMKPIQVSNDGGKKVNILGIPMVIRIHGRDTDGVVSAVESH